MGIRCGYNVWAQYVDTMCGHKMWAQCLGTMCGQEVWAQCRYAGRETSGLGGPKHEGTTLLRNVGNYQSTDVNFGKP